MEPQLQQNERETPLDSGYVSEAFRSVQGEGIFVGEQQIFVRLAGCSLTCSWCDTLYSKIRTPRFVVHDSEKRAFDNPVSLDRVIEEVKTLSAGAVKTVSVTGGEPFEQAGFARRLARRLRQSGFRVYMETNGIHAAELSETLSWIDVIAMDIKLPSALGVEAWDEHRAFLQALRGTGFDPAVDGESNRLFVKVVVDPSARVDEVETAARVVSSFSRAVPLVLQPESGALLGPDRDVSSRLLELIDDCRRVTRAYVDDVRVIPQCHKILDVR